MPSLILCRRSFVLLAVCALATAMSPPVLAQDTLFVKDDKVGIGTNAPAEKLHVLEAVDANTYITSENRGNGINSAGVLRARSNVAVVNFQAHGSSRTISRFGETLGGWAEFLQVNGNGLIIGTLGSKPLILGANNANVLEITPQGTVLYKGSQVHPDYVFDPEYELESIEEHAAYMWEHRHLPAVGAGRYADDGRAILELGASHAGLLEELEKAHIYIAQMNELLLAQGEENRQLAQRLAAVEARLLEPQDE